MRILLGIIYLWVSLGVSSLALAKDVIDASMTESFTFDKSYQLTPELEVLKVTVDSIKFDAENRQAIATLTNSSDVPVTPKLGVALFDEAGNLIAVADSKKANILSKSRVAVNKTADLRLNFSGYINDFDKVKTVKVVFAVLQKAKESSKKRRW